MSIPCAQTIIDVGGCGLSVGGFNVYGNRDSINAARDWKHAYDSIEEWRTSVLNERKRAEQLYEMLYSLGCRESCMGWVNERAESAERKLADL